MFRLGASVRVFALLALLAAVGLAAGANSATADDPPSVGDGTPIAESETPATAILEDAADSPSPTEDAGTGPDTPATTTPDDGEQSATEATPTTRQTGDASAQEIGSLVV